MNLITNVVQRFQDICRSTEGLNDEAAKQIDEMRYHAIIIAMTSANLAAGIALGITFPFCDELVNHKFTSYATATGCTVWSSVAAIFLYYEVTEFLSRDKIQLANNRRDFGDDFKECLKIVKINCENVDRICPVKNARLSKLELTIQS